MQSTLEQTNPARNVSVEPPENKSLHRVTFEEYLAMGDEAGEWIDGEVIQMAASSYFHEELFGFLFNVLRSYTQKHSLGKVLGSRFAMRLELLRRGREPDILFVATENIAKIKPTFLDGGADVAVEIVSPESFGRDRGEKFLEYEAAGIKEYWLIDYERKQAEFYRLDANGRYQLSPIENGIYQSEIVRDFWLKVEWLWTLPNELEVLKELKVI
jgi:Uma2 family endonuclease